MDSFSVYQYMQGCMSVPSEGVAGHGALWGRARSVKMVLKAWAAMAQDLHVTENKNTGAGDY